jgi:hypothetical protein
MAIPSVDLRASLRIQTCLPELGSSAKTEPAVSPYSSPYPSATPFGPPDGVIEW